MEPLVISPPVREHLARAIDSMKNDAQITTIFWEPVDYVALEIPDYPKVIARPMSFLTLKNALELNEYKNTHEFFADAQLVFSNCRVYNQKLPFYVGEADKAEQVFCSALHRQFGGDLGGFSSKVFKSTKYPQNTFDIYNGSVKCMEIAADTYQQVLRKISHLMYSMPQHLLGEVVDYYLRCKNDLISYGDEEIELQFEQDRDNWLMGNICVLLENKLMDGSKRGM